MKRRVILATAAAVGVSALAHRANAQVDPLPSWNDSAAKQTITDFVTRVTTPRGADFVAPEERIATFDNDGTLWSEQPVYFQVAFAIDRVKAMAPERVSGDLRIRALDRDSVGGDRCARFHCHGTVSEQRSAA